MKLKRLLRLVSEADDSTSIALITDDGEQISCPSPITVQDLMYLIEKMKDYETKSPQIVITL